MAARPAARHQTVLGVDVEAFCARERTTPDQVAVREALYSALRRAFERSEIPWPGCHREDRGDGALVLIPSDVPKARLSGSLPRELAAALDEHNARCEPNAQFRLRMSLHAGEVVHDEHGVVGACVNLTFRLLNAKPVKAALAASSAPLALVVSPWFHDEVVRNDPDSAPDAYERFRVYEKETRTYAFVRTVQNTTEPSRPSASPPEPSRLPRRNRFFTGRQDTLDRMARILLATPEVPPAACVLHGMGGVGKSQLAREFAHRFADRFDGVWWVDAGDPFSLVRDLDQLADRLGVPPDGGGRGAALLFHEIARRGQRWLIIYDNAEDQHDLAPWWPASDVGAVLVTSRTSSWTMADPIRVTPFTRDESLAFLAKAAGRADDTEHEVDSIAGTLGDLPLALAQAAAYAVRNRTGWRRYSELLDRAPAELMHLNGPDDYCGTAATTWSMSMARVGDERPESAHLLRLFTFFDPEHIPRDVVRPRLDLAPAWLNDLAEHPVDYDEAIGALSEYALVDATASTVTLHPLVRTMVQRSIPADELPEWTAVAAAVLEARFPRQPRESSSWRDCAALLPHAAAVARHSRRHLAAPVETSALLQRAAAYLQVRDQHQQALGILDHALALTAHAHGVRSPEYAELLVARGESDCYLGRHVSAVKTAREALDTMRAHTNPAHPSLIPALRLLGRALTETGDPGEAIGVLRDGADICERAHGMADRRTAELLARLAYATWRKGDLEQARAIYDQADVIWRKTAAAPDRERTVAYRWQAAVLCDLHEPDAARTAAVQAIEMARDLYGPDHVETIRAEEQLGIVIASSGRPAEGARLQERAAQFLREYYPVPVVVAGSLSALARTLLLNDRADEALATAQEAVDLYVEDHGTVDHCYNAAALTALGMAQRHLGLTEEAAESFDRARTIYETSGGPAHLLAEVKTEISLLS